MCGVTTTDWCRGKRMHLLYLQALNTQLQSIIHQRRREIEMVERSKKSDNNSNQDIDTEYSQ